MASTVRWMSVAFFALAPVANWWTSSKPASRSWLRAWA